MSIEVEAGAAPVPGWPPFVRLLEGWQAQAVLDTPEAREAFFRSLSIEEFDALVFAGNHAVRRWEGGRGYIPDDQTNIQLDEEYDGSHRLNACVLYRCIGGQYRRDLIDHAFDTAQGVDDPDAAIAMLGIAMIAIHPLHNGHTRITALGRQLLSPREGRGYRATDDDREFYAALSTDRDKYIAQSLHPMRGGLVAQYSGVVAANIMVDVGYAGAPIVGVESDDIGSVYKELPDYWAHNIRLAVSELLGERDFNLVTTLTYLRRQGVDPADCVTDDLSRPRISLPRFIDATRLAMGDGYDPYCDLRAAEADYKLDFVNAIVDCIAHNQTDFFGGRDAMLAEYPLPKQTA